MHDTAPTIAANAAIEPLSLPWKPESRTSRDLARLVRMAGARGPADVQLLRELGAALTGRDLDSNPWQPKG